MPLLFWYCKNEILSFLDKKMSEKKSKFLSFYENIIIVDPCQEGVLALMIPSELLLQYGNLIFDLRLWKFIFADFLSYIYFVSWYSKFL